MTPAGAGDGARGIPLDTSGQLCTESHYLIEKLVSLFKIPSSK